MRASRRAAGVLALALGASACLLPQEDHVNGVLLPVQDRPPQILESLLQPPDRFVTVQNGANCPNLVFSAPVTDPDVKNTLVYEFFVDPDVNAAFVKQDSLRNDGDAGRPDPATWEVSFSTAGPLQQPGQHVVELLVSDGSLVNRQTHPETITLDDGRTFLDPRYVVSYAWVVTVVAGPCP